MGNNADNRSVNTDALATLGTIIGPNEGRDAIHLAVEPVTAGERLTRGDRICLVPDGEGGYHALHEGDEKHGRTAAVGIVDPFLTHPTVYPGERFWLVVLPRQITSLRHVWEHPAFTPSEYQGPKKFTPEEQAAGNKGIRWVTATGVYGRPSAHDVREYLAVRGEEATCTCDECKKFYGEHTRIPETGTKQEAGSTPQKLFLDDLEDSMNDTRKAAEAMWKSSEEWLRHFAASADISYDRMMELAKTWEPDERNGSWGDYETRGAEWEGLSTGEDFWKHYEIVTGVAVPGGGSIFNCSCS